MIDLHIHILPELDDGAQSVDEALDMAETAVESGVETIVVTPHSNQRARFENYDKLGFVGGIIRIDNEAVAYTFGEPISDETFVTHFEKAPPEIQGAYPIINQEFTKNCLMNYKYVNREEDLGLEGLRKAKQSYFPEIFLKKCIAVYKG